jgi:hypothetical protein
MSVSSSALYVAYPTQLILCDGVNQVNTNWGVQITQIPHYAGHILQAVHTPSSPALHNPGGFPGMAT